MQRLAESEERYRLLAETASDGIVAMDASGAIVFANAAAARIFGYAAHELIGADLSVIIPEQLDGGVGLAGFPEHPHHLAVCADPCLRGARGGEPQRFADGTLEPIPVRPAIDHDQGKHLMSVAHCELPVPPGKRDIGAQSFEVLRKALSAPARPDHQQAVAPQQSVPEKPGGIAVQRRLAGTGSRKAKPM